VFARGKTEKAKGFEVSERGERTPEALVETGDLELELGLKKSPCRSMCGAFGENVERGFWYPEQAVLADLLARRGVGLPNSKEVGAVEDEPGASLGDCWWIVSEKGERLVACVTKMEGEFGWVPVSIAFG
jgi:hypothetical protein